MRDQDKENAKKEMTVNVASEELPVGQDNISIVETPELLSWRQPASKQDPEQPRRKAN